MHIIPLKQDKSPACEPGWKDETNYEHNTQLVVPGEMYGVLTGRPNNILVVDWDCYSDKCEFPITEDFLAWKAGGRESAYIVRTRSGGYHTYFAWDEESDSAIGRGRSGSKGSSISARRTITWSVRIPQAMSYYEAI